MEITNRDSSLDAEEYAVKSKLKKRRYKTGKDIRKRVSEHSVRGLVA